MISKSVLKALAVVLPLSLGAIAPAMAGSDRYSNDYSDRDYRDGDRDDSYSRDRDYDRDRGSYDRDHRRGYGYHWLSASEITYRLRARGYSRIRDVTYSRREGHYHAIANDTLGSTFRLSINVHSGRVTDREYLRGPRYRDYDRDYYSRYY